MMDNLKTLRDDDIDLIDIIQILWNRKWSIISITFITTLLSVIYILYKPNSFDVSTTIKSGKNSEFIEFMTIKEILSENDMLFSTEENPKGYSINKADIFGIFVNEFNDYEEMVNVLSNDAFVIESIKELSEDDKIKALFSLARSFKIILPVIRTELPKLSFRWHSLADGIYLFEKALQLTIKNVQTNLIRDIERLASSIDRKKNRKIDVLRKSLNLYEFKIEQEISRRVQYLNEQSAIAKELNLEINTFNESSINQPDSFKRMMKQEGGEKIINSGFNDFPYYLSDFNDFPYYLRGFKAIDKEIDIITQRTKEQQLLTNVGYIDTKEKILYAENSLASSQLRNSLKLIENANPNTWFVFDFAGSDVTSQKRSMLYLVLAVTLGGASSVIYVLLSNSLRKRKNELEKV